MTRRIESNPYPVYKGQDTTLHHIVAQHSGWLLLDVLSPDLSAFSPVAINRPLAWIAFCLGYYQNDSSRWTTFVEGNMSSPQGEDWRTNIVEEVEGIRHILLTSKRVAVLGMRSEKDHARPAFYVPQYLLSAGLQVIPVPVHNLQVDKILDQQVYRRLTDIPGDLDLVDVFRRSEDIPAHLDDLLAKRPTAVWFQSGIRNDEVAESLARAGIKVVQDRCLMVEHRRYVNHEMHN